MEIHEQHSSVKEYLMDAMKLRGISLEKLSEATNIPLHYVKAIIIGEVAMLPPAPYLRNYLLNIAEVLGIEGEELWVRYQKEYPMKRAGSSDLFPVNRFAIRSHLKTILTVCILIMLVVGYLLWRADTLWGAPVVVLSFPAEGVEVVYNPFLTVRGALENPNDKLVINGEEVLIASDGTFSHEVGLQLGLNSIEVMARRLLGKETKFVRQIIYQPPTTRSEPTNASESTNGNGITTSTEAETESVEE